MAYSDFTLPEALARFGLTLDTRHDLFGRVPPVEPDQAVRTLVERNNPLAVSINTEKSRSELLAAPVLAEVWRQSGYAVGHYSGNGFDVDPGDGLTGLADYLFTPGPQFPDPTPPILVVVEGKKESIPAGYGQCAAEMVAAQRLNRRANTGVETIYGSVTIGDNWRFLRLAGNDLAIDVPVYNIDRLDRILGILLFMVGYNPPPAATVVVPAAGPAAAAGGA